jgi:hypothetical protein
MPFAIAHMTWATKKTTISHDDHDICKETPWRVSTAKCNTTAGHNHTPPAAAWVLGPSYTPTPVGDTTPEGKDTDLVFDPSRISEANLRIYQKCFKDGTQMKLMVRFRDGTPEPLIINLSME